MMRISKRMLDKLTDQIQAELFSSYLYLQMAAQFETMGLKVFAQRFYMQEAEERMHAMKFFKYVLDIGGEVKLKAIQKPDGEWESVEDIIAAARDHEIKVTNMINELVALAETDKDYATRSFLQWFVDEQVEEVSSMEELLQLVRMAGPQGMLNLEYRLENMIKAQQSAETETGA